MELPNELYLHVFSFLEKRDLKALRLVCILFKELCNIILFTDPCMKRKLKIRITQLEHLPVIFLNNSYLKRFLDLSTFPTTVRVVILSQRKPTVSPEIIHLHPHIQFYISFGYIYPVNVHHGSNYNLKNVKLFSTAFSPMRYGVLREYNNFNFRYINLAHLESFRHKVIDAEAGLTVLSRLVVEKLVLLNATHFRFFPEQLLRLRNIICISSNIFPEGLLFPFTLIKEIQTLEIIFIERDVVFKVSEFEKITPILNTPLNFGFDYAGIKRVRSPCVICIKPPKCPLGKPFTLTGPASTWRTKLLRLYGFAG